MSNKKLRLDVEVSETLNDHLDKQSSIWGRSKRKTIELILINFFQPEKIERFAEAPLTPYNKEKK